MKPPNVSFPFDCDCCKKRFNSQSDVDADKKEVVLLSKEDRLKWQRQHYGNYAHLTPVFDIPPSKYLPPLYHYTENMFQWRFKHLIWDPAKDDSIRYDINDLLSEQIGFAHLPPKRGDTIYMMSFIGKDICNLRAKAEVMAKIIKMVYPQDFAAKEKEKEQPSVNVEVPDVDQCDHLYDNEDAMSEKSVEVQVADAMKAAEHLHADTLAKVQLVAEAFDCCWDATDELIVDDA